MSVYAHTLKVSEGNPELREEFYEAIETIIDKTPKRDAIILAGDFNHKKSHIIKWSTPYRNFQTWNGESRLNPVRNKIDYVIMRNEHGRFVTNSRAYGGIETETDHKPIKTEVNFEWYKIKLKSGKPQRKLDIKGFSNKSKQNEYNEEVRNNIDRIACQKSGQEKWNEICKVCMEGAEKVLGRIKQ